MGPVATARRRITRFDLADRHRDVPSQRHPGVGPTMGGRRRRPAAAAVTRHYELFDIAISAPTVGPGQSSRARVTASWVHSPLASYALAAALDVQRSFAQERWPTERALKVRLALHSGEARLRDESNYSGPVIIRCARLRSVAHGWRDPALRCGAGSCRRSTTQWGNATESRSPTPKRPRSPGTGVAALPLRDRDRFLPVDLYLMRGRTTFRRS